MARPRTPRSLEVIAVVREHLLVDGPTNLGAIADKFPDVPRSSFFKLVEVAKRELEDTAVNAQSPLALREAQRRIRARIDAPEVTERKMKAHLPQAPSPAVVASMSGTQIGQVFDFMGYFHRVVRDAEMLRNKAVKVDDNGQETVLNPGLMDNSIRRRLNIMDTYLQSMDQLYNLEKLQELYNMVIDEVGKADPATQQAILARLRKLNNDRGLTMAARPDGNT